MNLFLPCHVVKAVEMVDSLVKSVHPVLMVWHPRQDGRSAETEADAWTYNEVDPGRRISNVTNLRKKINFWGYKLRLTNFLEK